MEKSFCNDYKTFHSVISKIHSKSDSLQHLFCYYYYCYYYYLNSVLRKLYIYLRVICSLMISLNQVVVTHEFCIFRLWKYNTQNKTRSRCNNHLLHHRHSYDHAGHEVTGGTISHRRQIPGYQNWNHSSQEDRAEACEFEDNLCVGLHNCFPACHASEFVNLLYWKLEFLREFLRVVHNFEYDRFWWLCAFVKVFKRNRCRKNVEIASYIIYGSLFPAICDEPQFLFVYFIAPGRFHGSNSTNTRSLYELLS